MRTARSAVVSVSRSQVGLDHEDDFGSSHERKRAHRLATTFYGALLAYQPEGSAASTESPSLATCEQPHRSPAVPDFSESSLSGGNLGEPEKEAVTFALRAGVEDVDRAVSLVREGPKAWEAIQALLETEDDDRRERALALIEAGEPAHAARYLLCGEQSVQLQCPDDFGAGGCGHEHNYVPITCDSRMCRDCMKRRMGQLVNQYTGVVRQWADPTFLTLTIPNVSDPVKGVEGMKGSFGRFRRRVVPTAGTQGEKAWCWSVGTEPGGRPASPWKSRLLERGKDDLVRRLQSKYVSEGRGIPMDELLKGGLYAVDVKQKGPEEYNVHLHVLADAHFIPQAALSSVWEDVTGAAVVDVRRIYDRGAESLKSAIMETVAYATKPAEFENVEDEAEYVAEMKGSRLVQPFGSLHGEGVTFEVDLCCSRCGETPRWWNYQGVVREHRDNMELAGGGDGDRPPPES